MALVLRPSNIHSLGCYTTEPIRKGTFVIEYTGPRITVEEADERYSNCEQTYLFGLEDGKYVIDGQGVAAFINHSCVPNCETDEIDGRVWIIALRDIEAGEELTYEYELYDAGDEEDARCRCGAPGCRGTMYSDEELERRAKAESESCEKVS